jgi:hypothetical protein
VSDADLIAVSLTERQSIGIFFAEAMAVQGWCLTMLGQPEKGITQLTRWLKIHDLHGGIDTLGSIPRQVVLASAGARR